MRGEFAAFPAPGELVALLGPAGGGEIICWSRRPPGGRGLAACPMGPRGDERRVGSVEQWECRARAGLGKTGKTPAGAGRAEVAAGESRRGGRGQSPKGPALPRQETVTSFGGFQTPGRSKSPEC